MRYEFEIMPNVPMILCYTKAPPRKWRGSPGGERKRGIWTVGTFYKRQGEGVAVWIRRYYSRSIAPSSPAAQKTLKTYWHEIGHFWHDYASIYSDIFSEDTKENRENIASRFAAMMVEAKKGEKWLIRAMCGNIGSVGAYLSSLCS